MIFSKDKFSGHGQKGAPLSRYLIHRIFSAGREVGVKLPETPTTPLDYRFGSKLESHED